MTTIQQSFDFGHSPTTPDPTPTSSRRNLVIEAGAGTGKTTAIVAEVLRLMLEDESLAPERIVLMTFTEKAAGEIADRIRTALQELAEELADQLACEPAQGREASPLSWPLGSPNPLVVVTDRDRARRVVARQLENIDALRSQTIHSFCQSLLRSFPIEAGLDPQFKIIEGFERSLLYGQLYDAWIDDETRIHPTPEIVREWELLFAHVGYLFQIRELILTLINRRDLLAETEYDFGELAEVETSIVEAIDVARRCPDEVGDDACRRVFSYLRSAEPPAAGAAIDAWIEYLQPISASVREANLPRHGVLKEALRNLRAGNKGRSIHDRLVSHRAAMALVTLTRRFIAWLDAEKQRQGVVDFDDLLLRTLALLDDQGVLSRARAQFDSIFVDEFQDTDRTQARIVDRLARDDSGALVPGKTIVVGDPKQSIYGFRRADPETYYRMTEDLVRGGAERRLIRDQYRSLPPLVDVVNAMFTRLFPPEPIHDPNVFRPPYHPLRAARSGEESALDAHITMLYAEHDEKSDRFIVEAESIAAWIAARRDGSERDLQRFAILFRRLTKIDDYLDTLDRRGIDYVLPPTRLFLDRRAPVDLLAVLRAIAYPFDRGAQISAARTPYFGLTDVEIAAGANEREGMTAGESEAWQRFGESISRFREASGQLTVSQIIDLVIETTAIESVYAAAADGDRHLRHLEHVRAIAFDYDQHTAGSVRQFVDEITRRRGEPEEAEPSLIDESQNAVRIMSVHGAKGLEFDTVILPDLAFPTIMSETFQLFTVEEPRSLVISGRADSISANFRYTADGEKLKKLGGHREEAEMRRLFYVAVTRARTEVAFVCNLSSDTKNTGFLKCLSEALGVERPALAALWPERGRAVRETAIGPVAFERVETAEDGPRATSRRRRLRDPQLEADLSAAAVVPINIPMPEPITDILTPGEIAARRAGSRNRAAGILLHRIMELWDGTSAIEPLLARLSLAEAADEETIARVRERLRTIARSPMMERIARAETIGREMPIRFLEGGKTVELRIDRLIRENGRDLVIDYKSGHPDPARLDKDRQQINRYRRAISTMTGRDCGGVLWYVGLEGDWVVE